MSSSPAIIFSAVDFPEPEGPNEDHELAVLNVERHVLDRLETVRVPLRQMFQRDFGH
jgi:hypothetical protein